MTTPVRLGFVGLGQWGTRLAQAAPPAESADVAACFARSPDARTAFASEFDCRPFESVDALLESEVDAVVIATPIATHADLTIAAARAGKHVFVEKPLTNDFASAERTIAAVEDAGVVLQVGHQRRRLAATRHVGEWARAGDLGVVHSMEATIFNSDALTPRDDWKFDPSQRVLGAMTQQGVHMIDNMQYVAGSAARVSVFSKRVLGRGQSRDVTAFLIEYESGPVGVISNSAIGTWVASFAVHGTAGSAWSEDDGATLFRQAIDERRRREVTVTPTEPLAEQMAEFVACVRSGGSPEVGGDAALEVVAVLEAGVLSAERGCAVTLDEVRGRLD